MSGVAAIYHLNDKPVSKNDLLQLNAALQHHGQDGNGIWLDQHCGLAQQISRLTQESLHETLPLVNADYQITLAAHCRLFNYKELRNQLVSSNDRRPTGDAELILLAYLKWKLDFVKHLIGEFSIVLWDAKNKQLVCATDHFNSRPLYYYWDHKMFAIASEIYALHALSSIPRLPNLNKIARNDFLRFQLEPGETCFDKIRFLPAAHFMIVNPSGLHIKQYWKPQLGKLMSFKSEQAFADAFQDVFRSSVEATTRSHLPVCLQLSGGLDSSAIAMMASQVLAAQGKELICLSNVLPPNYVGTGKDEREFIEAVQAPNVIKCPIIDEWRGPFDHMEAFAKSLQYNPQHYQNRAAFAAARKQGAKFVLNGALGELTSSYHGHEYLAHVFRSGHWLRLYHEVLAHKKIYNRSLKKIIGGNIVLPLLPQAWQRLLKRKNNSMNMLKHSLTKPEFIHQHIPATELLKLSRAYAQLNTVKSTNPRENSLASVEWFLNHSATVFSDLDDAPNPSVYLSNPYFDKRFIEFCLNIPNEYRFRQGYARGIIRFGCKNLMPEKIRWRTCKEPFLPDYHNRYNQQLSQAQEIVDALAQHPLVQEVIDIKQLKALLTQTSTSNRLDTHTDFMNFLVIPRTIYLAKFLSSF